MQPSLRSTLIPMGAWLTIVFAPFLAHAQNAPVAWWSFDDMNNDVTNDSTSQLTDRIVGNTWRVPRVAGNALK